MFRFEQKERLDVESKLATLAPKMGKEVIDETWRQHPMLLSSSPWNQRRQLVTSL